MTAGSLTGPVEIVWRTSHPAQVSQALGVVRPSIRGDRSPVRLSLPPTSLLLEPAEVDRLELGAAVGALDAEASGAAVSGPRLAALGWATVDAGRAGVELGLWDVAGSQTVDPPSEPALGARGSLVPLGWTTLVLLEPATEGRLAAALARNGEGPVVLYVEGAGTADAVTLPPAPTPLGRMGRLVKPRLPSGPFVVLLDPHQRSR